MGLYNMLLAEKLSGGGSSGGLSKVVVGDFIVDTEEGTQDIQINYSGDSFPIALFVFPYDGGLTPVENGVVEVVSRYSIYAYALIKGNMTAPTYDTLADDNKAEEIVVYKSSSSDAKALTGKQSARKQMFGEDVSFFNNLFTSSNVFGIKVTSSPDYTFIPGGHYSYVVLYSE